tara:strand:- start:305 stop:457 length:153 start_codon:yes stop_codon:yes gene_type:complete
MKIKIEKYLAEIIILTIIIIAMSSCSSNKQFHVGTGEKLNKTCGGKHMYR